MKARLVCGVLTLLAGGCDLLLERRLSSEEISEHGSARFAAPREQVFRATEAALRARGFDLESSDAARGSIRTTAHLEKVVYPIHSRRLGEYESDVHYYRRYVARVEPDGDQVRVTLRPRLYEEQAEISGDAVWTIDDEKRRWRQLIDEIRDRIRENPAPHVE